MIYRSNLGAPDLQPFFKHAFSRPMHHSMGHDVLSDWSDKLDDDATFGLYKNCGFWTHDEAAILFQIATRVRGRWVDVGAHTGWTTAHVLGATQDIVTAVEPLFGKQADRAFITRFFENLRGVADNCTFAPTAITVFPGRASQFFDECNGARFSGIVIDGDHDRPAPLNDAMNAARVLADKGVILFHDFMGRPVQEGVEYLMDQGFGCKVYWTPHMIACCYRGEVSLPDHVRDPKLPWADVRALMPDFRWEGAIA